MSKLIESSCAVDHPEIVAIALDIMLTPARRAHYSPLVLVLADAAIENIRLQLAGVISSDTPATPVTLPAALPVQ